jgi:transcriptional regulator with XRE-family HTH domain
MDILMTQGTEFLKAFLKQHFEAHGAIADFCRKKGVGRNTVKRWISGETSPDVRELEMLASYFEVEIWELIHPKNAPTARSQNPTVEALTKLVADQEKRIKELETRLEASQAPMSNVEKLSDQVDLSHLPQSLLRIIANIPADRAKLAQQIIAASLSGILDEENKQKKKKPS